jgi:hypothetical protein
MSKSDWWNKRVLRSVDNLKFWQNNPRLDPAEEHIRLNDFVEDLISVESEKNSFLDLIKSISNQGFMPIDPVVVWQHENKQYIVAEGNRRVLALKLLRNPEKSPKSIRPIVSKQALLINRNDIEKIYVCCAPSFKASRWYVLQRHSTSSTQRTWQRLQQQNFILQLYDEVDQNIDTLILETGFDRSEVIQALRYVEVRNIATRPEILSQMTSDEAVWVKSYRMNMTVLERWFGSKEIKDKWGVEFDEMNVKITSDIQSFHNAYAQFLKLMYLGKECGLGFAINTRTIPERNQEILAVLPRVKFSNQGDDAVTASVLGDQNPETASPTNTPSGATITAPELTDQDDQNSIKPSIMDGHRHNPDRNQIVHPFCSINVSSAKLKAIFREFKLLPTERYKNVTAASLRVFLELSVDEYSHKYDLKNKMATDEKDSYNRITLQKKLKFLNENHLDDSHAKKVIDKILNHKNEHSLDTLNMYVHGCETHKTSKRFINGFWDLLIPLFIELIELKEK